MLIFSSQVLCLREKEHDLLLKGDQVHFITSEDVVDETTRTIEQKFPGYRGLVAAFLEIIEIEVVRRKEYIKQLPHYDVVRDKKDRHVLAAAVVSASDYIVTGDADLLMVERFKDIDIVKTQKMLSLL